MAEITREWQERPTLMEQVRSEIESTCKEWGINVILHEHSANFSNFAWFGDIGFAGDFTGGSADGVPEIRLAWDGCVNPLRVWWAFLHEMGHAHQWLEDSSTFRVACLLGTRTRNNLEIDAWRRAFEIASASRWPAENDFNVIAGLCLATYGLGNPFESVGQTSLESRAKSTRSIGER